MFGALPASVCVSLPVDHLLPHLCYFFICLLFNAKKKEKKKKRKCGSLTCGQQISTAKYFSFSFSSDFVVHHVHFSIFS